MSNRNKIEKKNGLPLSLVTVEIPVQEKIKNKMKAKSKNKPEPKVLLKPVMLNII